MYCCTNCFTDKEIIGFIYSNSTEIGNCGFCKSSNVHLIDVRELEELFQPIISIFKPISSLGIKVQDEKLLYQKLQETWKIFNPAQEINIRDMLITMFSDSIPTDDPLLNEAVEIELHYKEGLVADVHERKWENFAEEIKFKNRFFLNETIDLNLLRDLLKSFTKTYDPGKIFFRARVSNKDGYDIADMGKPPIEKATSGRANPSGIPYLYLSANLETTLYESRASYLDYITIAEFKLKQTLHVVSLREIISVSPFIFGDKLENYITHQKYLMRLEKELSKPVRRFDKELDYLPSQYLCEYVKSLGYDAIEYASSLKEGGINIAVFNDCKLQPSKVELFEIVDMNLGFKKIET